MKRVVHTFVISAVAALVSLSASSAQAFFEFNVFYNSESLSLVGSSAANGRTFFEGCVGFAIDKKADYLVGWNYSSFSTTDSADSVTKTYASTQMGPRFVFFFDKDHNWSLGLGYYLVTNATYQDGSKEAEKWKGTALKGDIGYNFPVRESLFLGVHLNYSSATYTETLKSGTDYSTDGHAKTLIYPSIYGIWMF